MLTHHRTDPGYPARTVVLGARGFVGRALVGHLERNGAAVRALGRDEVDLAADAAADRLAAELRDGDTVVFLSALTPDKGRGLAPFLANIKMAAAVCKALERASPGHVVYVSSDAVYPFRSALIDEQSCAEPADLYGAMHLAREIMVKQSAKAPVAILRPTSISGAGDTHNSYGPNRFRRMAQKDRRIALFGDGAETRDHIYVEDVAALIALVIRHRSAGTLNLATGRSVSFAELAGSVARLFDPPAEVVETPRQNPVTHRTFDVAALHRAFPDFAFTPLEAGLARAHGADEP